MSEKKNDIFYSKIIIYNKNIFYIIYCKVHCMKCNVPKLKVNISNDLEHTHKKICVWKKANFFNVTQTLEIDVYIVIKI